MWVFLFEPDNPDLARVLPPFWSGWTGFELQLRRGRSVVGCLGHHDQVIVRSNVDPSHWRVGSWSQMTSWRQTTHSHHFCLHRWSVSSRKRILFLLWPTDCSSVETSRTGCSVRQQHRIGYLFYSLNHHNINLCLSCNSDLTTCCISDARPASLCALGASSPSSPRSVDPARSESCWCTCASGGYTLHQRWVLLSQLIHCCHLALWNPDNLSSAWEQRCGNETSPCYNEESVY